MTSRKVLSYDGDHDVNDAEALKLLSGDNHPVDCVGGVWLYKQISRTTESILLLGAEGRFLDVEQCTIYFRPFCLAGVALEMGADVNILRVRA